MSILIPAMLVTVLVPVAVIIIPHSHNQAISGWRRIANVRTGAVTANVCAASDNAEEQQRS